MNLFDMSRTLPEAPSWCDAWRPEAPTPIPSDVRDVYLDFETTGIRWDKNDQPGGVAVLHAGQPDGKYYPWAHRQGPNLDRSQVLDYLRTELRGKNVVNLNTRFEVHMSKNAGCDLEAAGATVSDVAHYAALLDDHRRSFSLESLVDAYLFDGESKVKTVDGVALDATRMMDYHPAIVARRAIADVRQVKKLRDVMWPRLDAEDLQRVRALEDRLIYPVVAMERNGAVIDTDKLDRWVKKSEQDYLRALYRVAKAVGFQVNPNSPNDMKRLFKTLGIDAVTTAGKSLEDDDAGRVSLRAYALARYDHPVIKDVARAIKLASLRSKYLVKYRKTIGADRILRYALHQLRGDEGGTISGRFSSSALFHREGVGANIQQVMASAKQRVAFGYEEDDETHDDEIFLIRELFVAGSGLFFAADAMQIEYRIFASRAKTPRILAAYAQDVRTNFHKLVWAMVKELAPQVTYKQQKNLNFATIYGAGLPKLCFMLGLITEAEFNMLSNMPGFKRDAFARQHNITGYFEGKKIKAIYERVLPEVAPMLKDAIRCAEQDGYVTTFLGRRSRFIDRQRMHKALNAMIQGDAAEENKIRICELYEHHKGLGFTMRATVHDEIFGDVVDVEHAEKIEQFLNEQTERRFNVPILWEAEHGANWAGKVA